MNFSYSCISERRECPQAHHFDYNMRLRRNKPVKALSIGTDVHRLLEARNKGEDLDEVKGEIFAAYDKLPRNQQDGLGDGYVENVFNIFRDYCSYYSEEKRDVVLTEYLYEIPLNANHNFVGRMDFVERDAEGLMIGDYKTFSKEPDSSTLVLNVQSALYAKACEKILCERPTRMRWDYIRSVAAPEPIWLEKTKRFSRAFKSSSQPVTIFSWVRAHEKAGLNPYDDLSQSEIEQLKLNCEYYYKRITLPIQPLMVGMIWGDYLSTVKDIIREPEKQVKHIGRNCAWCEYQPLCMAEGTGADINYIIKRDYILKEDK